jgi:anti-sigma-K factor RskA
MLRPSSVARVRAELGALEASAERAGTALARIQAPAEELGAAELGAGRAAGAWRSFPIDGMRLILAVTAIAAVAALAAIGALAAISL